MSNNHAEDAEYNEHEFDMEDTDDEIVDEVGGNDMSSSDSEDDDLDFKGSDTSSAQFQKGKDIQGIHWDRLDTTREQYRTTRLERYNNYRDIPDSGEVSDEECKVAKKGASFYCFRQNSTSIKPTIHRFQLRNLVWATSKHDVYFMSDSAAIHWSSLTCSTQEVLDVSGHVAPSEKHPGSLLEGFTDTQVSTLAVKDKLLVAGGVSAELICKHLDRPGVSYCALATYDENGTTNAIEIYDSPSGALHFTASNNDCGVRDFDMEKYQLVRHLSFPWPVNHTSMNPEGKLLIVVGGDLEGLLVDSNTGKKVASLWGHIDYSFASAWHPDGIMFATGNQDKTCRIWDKRNLSRSVAALKGNLAAIQSIHYSSDGRYMAVAEAADFVHVYDVKKEYDTEQEIDFFGEISGISFSPDTESLFIGISAFPTTGSLMEYGRLRDNSRTDAFV